MWHLRWLRPQAMLGFRGFHGPIDTSAQAALAPHQTMEQEESSDTTFMVM
jgi:hypothetical protein